MKSLLKAVERDDESRGVIETLMKVGISNDDDSSLKAMPFDSSLKAMPFGPNVEETRGLLSPEDSISSLELADTTDLCKQSENGMVRPHKTLISPVNGKTNGRTACREN